MADPHRLILDALPCAVVLLDAQGRIVFANSAFVQLIATPDVSSLLQRINHDRLNWRGQLYDVEERHMAQGRLLLISERRSSREPRTDLLDRAGTFAALEQLALDTDLWQRSSLILLRIERFDSISATFGHQIRDCVLIMLGQCLVETAPDGVLLGHVAEDRFAVILTNHLSISRTEALAELFIANLSKPMAIEDHHITVTVCAGAAAVETVGEEVEDLVERAYMALADAHHRGPGAVTFFGPEVAKRVEQHRKIEIDLRHALERNEFEVFYQPIVTSKDGVMVGAEALLRWHHPSRGLIAPDIFIPVAEKAGLISAMTRWVLARVCEEAKQWPSHLFVSVNLSALLFDDPHLVDTVRQILSDADFPSHRLELEITESVFLSDERSLETLQLFKALGMRIAIDDFGTGFSSLNYLRAFPFDKIKIDHTFISEMMINREASAIVSAVLQLARDLDMGVTAEGVENEHQASLLRKRGCDFLQGFLFARPMPAKPILDYIKSHGRS